MDLIFWEGQNSVRLSRLNKGLFRTVSAAYEVAMNQTILGETLGAVRDAFALRWANLKWYFTPYDPVCSHSLNGECEECEIERLEANNAC